MSEREYDYLREFYKAAMTDKKKTSKVLNSAVKPAGGPNGLRPSTHQLTNLQATCKSAARKIMTLLQTDGVDTFETLESLSAIIYQEFRERHEL